MNHLCNNPTINETITNDNVYDILEDDKGNLWISTYGGGLHYFNINSRQFVQVPSSYNLGEGIEVDKNGNVWMLANSALHKYDVASGSYTNYQLPDIEKTGGPSGYIYKDDAGRLYVSGLNYFIRFHPDSICELSHQPKVFLTDFRIFNDSYSDLLME